MNGSMKRERWISGWMNGERERRTDGWMDGQRERDG